MQIVFSSPENPELHSHLPAVLVHFAFASQSLSLLFKRQSAKVSGLKIENIKSGRSQKCLSEGFKNCLQLKLTA